MMRNNVFSGEFSDEGQLVRLRLVSDPQSMNWVIDPEYLEETGYHEDDKLFGEFDITFDAKRRTSRELTRHVDTSKPGVEQVTYDAGPLKVEFDYDFHVEGGLDFDIRLSNESARPLVIEDFGVWIPFAYIMFRDPNVLRNIHQSAAAFPSISPSFTKLAMHRRSNIAPHVGLFQTYGETKSIGTFCAYTNLFFENVSPSLDGMLFHKLILAGGYASGQEPRSDWIYRHDPVTVGVGERRSWTYRLAPYQDLPDFYRVAQSLGHPHVTYSPLALTGEHLAVDIEPPAGRTIESVAVTDQVDGTVNTKDVTNTLQRRSSHSHLDVPVTHPGEHVVTITLDDGSADEVVSNVFDSVAETLAARADYISDVLYQGPDGEVAYAFSPVSNQGESLGKLSLVLKQNLMGELKPEQVRRVEASVVNYVRPKWFESGDFFKPKPLYGDFYRVMDFEYIGHLCYLLSRFDDSILQLNKPHTYLEWAAKVFEMRVNPDRHNNARAKEETQMLGVFFLYIDDLLTSLRDEGLHDTYEVISRLWTEIIDRVAANSAEYKSAVTEHYYDNAGFGPAAGALATFGKDEAARQYAELLVANIGYSNDFRAQNPDRWWEALSYMIHSLWGGVSAAAMLKAYEELHDTAYLLAAFRATAAVLYCYDTDATATTLRLDTGQAASTYSVAGPHINRPDLSRNRFGQATFARDGGIFARLFPDPDQSPDWDMGEELVAYLDGFGRKTFLYDGFDGSLQIVNGALEKADDGWVIESFAPYPLEYHYYDGGRHAIFDTPTRRVAFRSGAFISIA